MQKNLNGFHHKYSSCGHSCGPVTVVGAINGLFIYNRWVSTNSFLRIWLPSRCCTAHLDVFPKVSSLPPINSTSDFFFFFLRVGVDMDSPTLRQLVALVQSNRNFSLHSLVHFWELFGAGFPPCSGPYGRLRSIMFPGVNVLTWLLRGASLGPPPAILGSILLLSILCLP